MSQQICAKVQDKKEEKSWMADATNKYTVTFEVGYPESDGKDDAKKNFSGTTLSLVTYDKKVAAQFKVGDEVYINVKPK